MRKINKNVLTIFEKDIQLVKYKLINIKNNDIHIINMSNNFKLIRNNYYDEKK